MLYNKIDELKTVITYEKQRYKVTLKEIYMYNNTNNIIDCHVHFSNFKVQQNFFNNYMAANNTLFPSFSFIVKIRFVLYLFFILKIRSSEPWVKHPSALFSCLRNRVPS